MLKQETDLALCRYATPVWIQPNSNQPSTDTDNLDVADVVSENALRKKLDLQWGDVIRLGTFFSVGNFHRYLLAFMQ